MLNFLIKEYGKFAVTFTGLTSLQLPAVISCAENGSILSKLQRFGFPLNMSNRFMKHHLSFSPGNMRQGRYYTMVTSLFHHSEPSHLLTNLVMLVSSGANVHATIGRWHFLSAFLGGGIVGNLAMWVHYLIDKGRLENGIIHPTEWPIFGDTIIGQSLDNGKRQILSSTFDSVNLWLSCIGCSACVSAIVSIGTCITLRTLVTRLRRAFGRNGPFIEPGENTFEDNIDLTYDVIRVAFTCSFAWDDLQAVLGSGSGSSVFAHSFSSIGHSGHLGGFLFGILYYWYFFYRR